MIRIIFKSADLQANVFQQMKNSRRMSMIDLPGQKDIRCGGSFMIFNKHRDLLKILVNFSEFFKHESCGICTPCRAGNFIIQRKLDRLNNGFANETDLDEIKNWGTVMKNTSRCGLGKTAANSLIMHWINFMIILKRSLIKILMD